MKQKVALFGGSFDPVHLGHLALAAAAYRQLGLASLQLLPTGHAWQKTRPLTAAKHRIAMLRLAAATLGPWASINPLETERAGPSYMIDSLDALDAAQGRQDWFILLGSDQLTNFCSWRDWAQIAARASLAVGIRPGTIWQPPAALLALAPQLVRIDLTPVDLSSSLIRQQVACGSNLAGLVTPQIAQYIASHNLYKEH